MKKSVAYSKHIATIFAKDLNEDENRNCDDSSWQEFLNDDNWYL